MPQFTVPVAFQRLDDAQEHGHEYVTALAAELDVPKVDDPDDQGVFRVEVEAESWEDARNRVWYGIEQTRMADFVDFVGEAPTA
jgi:hypothetical protein